MIEFLVNLFGASWRTTILGWVGIVTGGGLLLAAGGAFLKAAFDSDPLTVPDWNQVSLAWVALISGFKGLVTRDNKVSSQAVKETGATVE